MVDFEDVSLMAKITTVKINELVTASTEGWILEIDIASRQSGSGLGVMHPTPKSATNTPSHLMRIPEHQ